MASNIIPAKDDDVLRTNYDNVYVYTITGNYSAKNWYADLTAGDGVKILAGTITKTYDAGAGETDIEITFSKADIATKVTAGTIIVGRQYFFDLKLDDTTESCFVSCTLDCILGQTTSALS